MSSSTQQRLERRVTEAAEAALRELHYVAPVDVLVRLGWLAPSHLDAWRQGRVDNLEQVIQVGRGKLTRTLPILRAWAQQRGLEPSETAYVARTRDRRTLRFGVSGNPDVERAYRTHWVDPELSDRKRERLAERASRPPDLVVVDPLNDVDCVECGRDCALLLMEDAGPLCLTCADLDHLVFLPAGDAALTRRAKKASGLAAVVVRFSRARKRYERQGVLVEEEALAVAERACLDDADARARRRERDRLRRATQDEQFVGQLTEAILAHYPGCPPARAAAIAAHTAVRGSGRVGRTASARELDPAAIDLAVAASVRHLDTDYDKLLMSGTDRVDAREQVRPQVQTVLAAWRTAAGP